jgi:hypothetical protein
VNLRCVRSQPKDGVKLLNNHRECIINWELFASQRTHCRLNENQEQQRTDKQERNEAETDSDRNVNHHGSAIF